VSSFFSPARGNSLHVHEDSTTNHNNTTNNNGNRRKTIRFSIPHNESRSTECPTLNDNLYEALELFDKERVERLLKQGNVDVNQILPENSLSLLHLSVGFSENYPTIVEVLLRHKGDPNNNKDVENGLSPMHLSVINDFDKVTAILMRYGGDPKKVNSD